MRIEGIRTLEGPNVHHHKPVMVMELQLLDLDERESREFLGFNEALLELLPGLRRHHCGLGREGGFVERLMDGTYFGHVVEHVALELAGQLGREFTYGKTRHAGPPGLYHVIVRYESEPVMRRVLESAVELVVALLSGVEFPLEARLEETRRLDEETRLGPSTLAIVDAAERRGIPWRRLDGDSLIQFGHGVHRKFLRAALTGDSSHIAVETASDKELTKRLLQEAFLPVPRGMTAESADDAVRFLEEYGGPVVVKPADGNQGRGVTMNLNDGQAVRDAFERARAHSPRVLVERQIEGRDYRLLVVAGTLVAASERRPCRVWGDGVSSIAQLLQRLNADPRRGVGHERPLTRVPLDETTLAVLADQGFRPDDVLPAGAVARVRDGANLSQGGEAVDVTDLVHPEIREVCERAARAIGLDVCGVDLVTEDIGKPLTGAIVELNAAPGLRMHLHPSSGRSRPVGEAIVDALYPAGANGRIPICAVTGTNGKTTVARLVGHVLGMAGARVGMTTTDGVYVAGRKAASGDMTGPASARAVLSDPTVEAAVLETARGGIVKRGLGYDWADVAVVTNICMDHIGQDGIDDIEDLVWIKSLVAERVRDRGTLVLNGEDPQAAALVDRPRIRGRDLEVVMFGIDPQAPALASHLLSGGTTCTVRNGWVVVERGNSRRRLFELADIPLVQGGGAAHQVSNVLAATAACRALEVPAAAIRDGLRAFRSALHNPGRANLYRYGQGFVLVDYGHNPDAFAATCAMAASWNRQLIGIVGMPGDRDDSVMQEAAVVLANGFHRLVIREDRDRRGRKPGEMADLLWREVRGIAPDLPSKVILDECEALRAVLGEVSAGSAAVIFYEDLDGVLATLRQAGAEPLEEGALPSRPPASLGGTTRTSPPPAA